MIRTRRTAADRMAEANFYRVQTESAREARIAAHRTASVPTVDLRMCEHDKARRCLKLASEYFGMPRELFVDSHHTGRLVRFVPVQPGDPLFDEDGWDGEQQIYRPAAGEDRTRVEYLVIYNQY